MKSRLPTIALILLLAAIPGLHAAELPDLGSSADAVLTPRQSRLIGASTLHHLRAQGKVLEDPLLHGYINDLGYRLLAHTNFPDNLDFTFFVVNSDTINAFAVPGGYIGVHSGLIAATRNEDELASVLAHEIAHITQSHIQRSIEDARKMAPLAGLALLGAVLATQAGGSGDAAPAILIGGMGAVAQRRINFTRKDEAEADRIGIQTLAAAGFDPDGMANFFSRMQQLLRPSTSGMQVPPLLRSHPVTSQRISEARARARALKQERGAAPGATLGSTVEWSDTVAPLAFVSSAKALYSPTADRRGDTSEFNYLLMRERAREMAAPSRTRILEYYQANLHGADKFDTPANHYGYALALVRNNQAEDAIPQLAALLDEHPHNTALRLAMANARLHAGQRDQALAAYAEMKQQMPLSHAVAEAYAEALLANGKADSAAKAVAVLKPLLDEQVDEPTLYRTYGHANVLAGHKVRAAMAYAAATYLSGHATDALNQLERLLDNEDLSYYQRAEVQARIDALTPIVMELKRRGIKPGEQGIG